MNKKVFIGIDVSKLTLDFCIKENDKKTFLNIENKASVIKKAFKPFKGKDVIVCMENTGKYNQQLYQVLKKLPFKTFVCNPQQIKYSIGFVRGKNDKIDAERICNYIIKNHLEERPWKPTTEALDDLKVLMSERRTLIDSRKKVTIQIKELSQIKTSKVLKIIKLKQADLKYFNQRIKQIETMIREVIKEEQELSEYFKRLTSIPGVGEVTAWYFIVKTNGFTRLTDPRKLGSYAGVVPFQYTSGTSVTSKARVSKKADKEFKTVLQMAAMRAVRLDNNHFEKFYNRKIQQGKNPMSVLNAIRNKIIHVALALINNKTFYQNNLVLS